MNDKISIVVPVYNVVNYLSDCLDSIINQSYKNLEVLLIDDGSIDGSGDLCDQYAQKDSRIKVIHQKNSGAAAAKNVGLQIAKGKYLSFVDSDDYLEKDAYSYMVEQLEKNDADVIQCSFRNVYQNQKTEFITLNDFEEFNKIDFLRRFTKDWTCGLLWDKLYRRELFYGIMFEEGHKIDDEFFTYQGIMNAKKIVHSPKIVYNYRKRKSSVMLEKESQQKIVLDKINYLEKRRIKVVSRFPELKQDFDYHFLSMLVILSKDSAATIESIKETQRVLNKYFSGGKHCKIDFSLRKQLFLLKHRNAEKMLKSCKNIVSKNEDYQCFE